MAPCAPSASSSDPAYPSAEIPVPTDRGFEPITTYPGRRHYFHRDVVGLLDAFSARESTEFEVFKEEFAARNFSYICDVHPKEVPQDVITLLADVIYTLAPAYNLGCIYLLYCVYYCQPIDARYSLSICRSDLRLLADIARDRSPSVPIIGQLLNKLVRDNAFAVSVKKCPVTTYFSGKGFYERIKREHAQGLQNVGSKTRMKGRCAIAGARLVAQDGGGEIIDFDALRERVATHSDIRSEIVTRMRERFNEFIKYRKTDTRSALVHLPPPKAPVRLKKMDKSSAKPNSERLGTRDLLAMVGGVRIEDVDMSRVGETRRLKPPRQIASLEDTPAAVAALEDATDSKEERRRAKDENEENRQGVKTVKKNSKRDTVKKQEQRV